MKIIKNLKILKAMAKKKLIVLHKDTGKIVRWQGMKVRANYIQDGKSKFKYNGKDFATTYISGSFYPYVVKI